MFAGFPNQSPPLTMLKGNREHTQQGMNNPPQGGYTGFQVIRIIECPAPGSNGGKNQNPKNSLGLPTKPQKLPGQKIDPKKSHAEFPSLENFQKALNDVTKNKTEIDCLCLFLHHAIWSCHTSTTTSLQIVLNTQKNPFLNQATEKKCFPNLLPKKIPDSKVSNPKKSFDHPYHLKSGVPPLGNPLQATSGARYRRYILQDFDSVSSSALQTTWPLDHRQRTYSIWTSTST